MKYITLIIGLLVVGCCTAPRPDTNESTPTTNTNEVSGTTVKPVKELTVEEKVVGTYEMKIPQAKEISIRMVFLENGVYEGYINIGGEFEGWVKEIETKWSISREGEVHSILEEGIGVLKINKDGSLTAIALIDKDGKRGDYPKEKQGTFIKTKDRIAPPNPSPPPPSHSSYTNKLKHNTQTKSAINKLKKVKAYEIHYIDDCGGGVGGVSRESATRVVDKCAAAI
jgi:hypothetical protein